MNKKVLRFYRLLKSHYDHAKINFPDISSECCTKTALFGISTLLHSYTDARDELAIYSNEIKEFLNCHKGEINYSLMPKSRVYALKIYYISEHLFAAIAKVLSKTQDELNEEALNLDMAWKEGIKPCTLIALALFKVLGIQIIVPSNKKEFEGMHYKNFQNIVITGSRQKNGFEIEEWVEHFKGHGINVYSPQIAKNSKDNLVMEEAKHLQAVCKCDTLIVCNSNADGYIGDSTLFDIGYAIAKEKRVITTSMPQKDVFEQIAVEVGIYEEK